MPYDIHTSLPAYHEHKQGKDYCRQIVLSTIGKLQPCTDKQISEFLNWPINRVTPRRGELVSDDKVTKAKTDKDPSSGRTVNYWEVKNSVKQAKLF